MGFVSMRLQKGSADVDGSDGADVPVFAEEGHPYGHKLAHMGVVIEIRTI